MVEAAKDARPAIEFIGVSKGFQTAQGRHLVLDDVNFTIPQGKTTVIAGGSGQGKSVTLKLILGLLRPDSGQVMVGQKDVPTLNRRALQTLRTEFGVLFQGAALFDSLTVFDNVALPLRERTHLAEVVLRKRVLETLEQLELAGHEEKYPAQLSGGMQKRVGLARALQLSPKIVLFDEPTTGLDPLMTQEIYRLFYKTQQRLGYTAVIVSHDIPKIFSLADQVILLNRGVIDLFESPEAIQWSKKAHIREFVATTMGQVYESEKMESFNE